MITQAFVSSHTKDIAERLLNYRGDNLVGVQRASELPRSAEGVTVHWCPDICSMKFQCDSLTVSDPNGQFFPSLEGAEVALYEMPGIVMDNKDYLSMVLGNPPVAQGMIEQGKVTLSPTTIESLYVQITLKRFPLGI